MYKFLIFICCALITACTPVQENEETYDFSSIAILPELTSAPATTVSQQNQDQQNVQVISATSEQPLTISASKTYMAEMAKKLKKTTSDSSITIKQMDNKIVVVMPDSAIFGSNQTTLDTQAEPVLAEMARTIKEYDRTKIQIFGYTDDTGTISENRAFSLQQANAVSNFLRLNGVDINCIVVDGLGPENPIANNNTAVNRRKNRRVEMTLINVQ